MMQIGAVNYVAVVAAAIAGMIVGMLWYGPLFGKKWMKPMGFSGKGMKSMKMKAQTSMALGFVAVLISSFVLAHFVSGIGLTNALAVGFLLWLGFMLPISAGSVLWEGKDSELFYLNAAHGLVGMLVMSAVIALLG